MVCLSQRSRWGSHHGPRPSSLSGGPRSALHCEMSVSPVTQAVKYLHRKQRRRGAVTLAHPFSGSRGNDKITLTRWLRDDERRHKKSRETINFSEGNTFIWVTSHYPCRATDKRITSQMHSSLRRAEQNILRPPNQDGIKNKPSERWTVFADT